MRWEGRRRSTNVEDRRGMSPGKIAVGGGIGGIIIALLVLFLGGDPSAIFDQMQNNQITQGPYTPTAEEQKMVEFVEVVLGDTEDVWTKTFQEAGREYRKPKLVLFSGAVESACGFAQAATGPFYCPGDETVYMDLNYLSILQQRLGINGEFAVAYIIAHEVGHHVQNLSGVLGEVQQQSQRLSQTQGNALTVRLELQADFLAGYWAHHAQKMFNILEDGDIESAMNAAAAVGDDNIQRKTQGTIRPDSFTHGTSAQRKEWFVKGFQSGDLNLGDTFQRGAI